ncbi:aldolase/citrate lyase family protein [Microvirga aerilata]
MGDPEYFAAANRISLAIAQIESREGLAIVDQILATPVDGIFLGPSDLSIALSNGARVDPTGRETTEALQHCVRLARAVGKFAGVYAPTGERAAALLEIGFTYVALGSDEWLMRAGAKAFLTKARAGLRQVPQVA